MADTDLNQEELFNLENELEANDDFNESPPSDIVAYNELRSCADLLRMYEEKQLEIQPEFQREIVWNNSMKTRLIDSLTKQLPIPSLCISFDYKTQERFVIDGLQRIATIIQFLDDDTKKEWKLAKLEDIDDKISGKTNLTIKKKYSDIFSKVQNTVLPITVIRCDYSKKSHMNYLFTIFHRLNSGGSKLTNQEIRNCIYNGKLNSLLRELKDDINYKLLFNIEEEKVYRFSNEELILRFLAFYSNLSKYNGSLSKFLNDYMEDNKNPNDHKIDELREIFLRSISLILNNITNNLPLKRLSKATTEALLIGIAHNIHALEAEKPSDTKQRFENLKNDPLFSIEELKEGLAQKDKVINRINKAIEIFQ
uniref:DUF262 domain-containing protein n=1 Tax=Flavobacterium sp. Root935 TaxID=1736610 RepID=UPI0009E98A76|nr:DUF262 domain-containing protein [Flavobacterium sp. Root935]